MQKSDPHSYFCMILQGVDEKKERKKARLAWNKNPILNYGWGSNIACAPVKYIRSETQSRPETVCIG